MVMATPRRRLVRQQPLASRIFAYINPLDNLLALTSTFEAWDAEAWGGRLATPLGLTLNVVCLFARLNANTNLGLFGKRRSNDILLRPGESVTDVHRGGFGYFMGLVAWFLMAFSILNFIQCFTKKRPYRLFEHDILATPATPSARRVRVSSTPNNSSPLRMLQNIYEPVTSIFSTNLDPPDDGLTENEVWEVSVWDPTPFSLRLFSLFSPAHAAVYFLSLPVTSNATYSYNGETTSTTNTFATVVKVLVTLILMTTQFMFMAQRFSDQREDGNFVHRQVAKEYERKFVNPRLNTLKRDVATSTDQGGSVEASPSLGNSFKIMPNPVYARHAEKRESWSSGKPVQEPPYKPSQKPVHKPEFGSLGRNSGQFAAQAKLRSSMGGFGEAVADSPKGRSLSPKKRVTNLFGGDVDYGVPSPVRRVTRDRGI